MMAGSWSTLYQVAENRTLSQVSNGADTSEWQGSDVSDRVIGASCGGDLW